MSFRASPHDVRNSFERLFKTAPSLDKLKDAALGGDLLCNAQDTYDPSNGMLPGRSLAWKLFLLPAAPLTESLSAIPSPPLDALRSARSRYANLIRTELRAPDGSYEEWMDVPGAGIGDPQRNTTDNWTFNNPLSLDAESGWNEWFAAVELRRGIRQDVERTFPDIEYFRDHRVQSLLTSILYVYCIQHKDVGYRQGMHELLAPLLYAVDFDSIERSTSQSNENEVLAELCDRTWIAADAHALFEVIMNGVGSWYEWQETTLQPSSPIGLAVPGSLEPVYTKPWVAPIIEVCNLIHSDYLKHSDPALWSALQNSQVEPQIFGIRWLRLLFTREFGIEDAMFLWDGLFASDATLQMSKWICVAMLIRIRNHLIPSDYTTQLGYLLRYPTVTPVDSISHIALLLQQAHALRADPIPSTTVSLVMQNKDALGIPSEVPELPAPRRRASGKRPPTDGTGSRPSRSSTSGIETRRDPFGLPLPIPELFSKGLSDINGAVHSTVSEIRRNLPELARQVSTSEPSIPFPYQSLMSSKTRPRLDREATEKEGSQWEPRTRFEIEREVALYSSMNRRLGKALSWAVDALMEDASDLPSDPLMETSTGPTERREALECLGYIRDVLGTGRAMPVSQLEDERLLGETEYRGLREEQAKTGYYDALHFDTRKDHGDIVPKSAAVGRSSSPVVPTLPAQAAQGSITDSTSKPLSRQALASYQSNRDSTPAPSLSRGPLIPPLPSSTSPRDAPTNVSRPEHPHTSLFDRKLAGTTVVTGTPVAHSFIRSSSGFGAGHVVHGVLHSSPNLGVSSEGSEVLRPSLSLYGPNAGSLSNGSDAQVSDDVARMPQKYQSDPLRG